MESFNVTPMVDGILWNVVHYYIKKDYEETIIGYHNRCDYLYIDMAITSIKDKQYWER